MDKALEEFKSGSEGELFIEEWKESDDGKAFQGEHFKTGFKQFVVAAKKKFPGLTLDLDSVQLEDLFGDEEESVAAGGDTAEAAKESDPARVGVETNQTLSSTTTSPTPMEQMPTSTPGTVPAAADLDPP